MRVRGSLRCCGVACGDVLLVLRKGLLGLWESCRMEMERGRRVFGVLVTLRVSCAGLCARDACAERGTRAGDASRLGALSSHAAAPP